MVNFTDTLAKTPDEIEKPPLPPVGTYRFTITKVPDIQENVKDTWDIVNFPVQAISAEEDVDADALAEFGDVRNIRLRHSFLFDKTDEASFKKTEWAMRKFLEETLGCWEAGSSLKEAMNNSVNQQFLGAVGWKPDKNNPENINANIGKVAPV